MRMQEKSKTRIRRTREELDCLLTHRDWNVRERAVFDDDISVRQLKLVLKDEEECVLNAAAFVIKQLYNQAKKVTGE